MTIQTKLHQESSNLKSPINASDQAIQSPTKDSLFHSPSVKGPSQRQGHPKPSASLQNLISSTRRDARRGTCKLDRSVSKKTVENWVFVVRAFTFASRIGAVAKQFTKLLMLGVNTASEVVTVEKTLTEYLKVLSMEKDNPSTLLLRKLLLVPQDQRNEQHCEEIESVLLDRITGFSQSFQKRERLYLCQQICFEPFKKGSVLCWPDHPATYFYFILYGNVDIFKISRGEKRTVERIPSGSTFGNDRLSVDENGNRSAMAMVTQDSILLSIQRSRFLEFTQGLGYHPKLHLLESMSIFAKMPELFDKLSRFFVVSDFKVDDVLATEGKVLSRVSWILLGDVSVTQKVPILVRTEGLKTVQVAYKDGHVLKPNEKITHLQLATQTAGSGAHFPLLPVLGSNAETIKYLGGDYMEKAAYEGVFHDGCKGPDKVEILSPYTIICKTNAVVASIPIPDLVQLVPKESLYDLVFIPTIHHFPIAQLQTQYLDERAWMKHKGDSFPIAKK
ncbi:hypothetical protein HDU91_005088 [Kappamyces sp. JEL0680]|nr:hypothetical protein HDU91_005088 [Kappamyces sp. JEL0680]